MVDKAPTPPYDALLKRCVGQLVTHAAYTDPNDDTWGDHGEVVLVFENGLRLVLDSTGYDASDIHVRECHGPGAECDPED